MRGVIAILLLLPSVCMAETVQVSALGQCANGQCTTSYGSASIIGKTAEGKAVLLTAGHVVDGASNIRVAWGGGHVPAKVFASRNDDDVDAAILVAAIPGRWTCTEVSGDVPESAAVIVSGFPGDSLAVGSQRNGVWRGRYVERVTVHPGDSGGPVFYRGRVVGVVSGYRRDARQTVVCTPGASIVAWMTVTLGYVPRCECVPVPTPRPAVKPSPIALAPAPPPPPDEVDLSPILSRLDAINARLKRLEEMPLPSAEPGQPGERGATGPVGPRGEKGDRGPAGIACDSREIASLREEIAALKDSKVRVEIQQNGTTIDSEDYPLTGPIKLDFRGSDDTLKRIQRLEELVARLTTQGNLSAGK